MPEKSIILHAHEIWRLLDAGEVQIWRPVKNVESDCIKLRDGSYFPLPTCDRIKQTHWSTTPTFCPFQPGERRWVKETWAWTPAGDYCTIPLQPQDNLIYYKASANSPDSSGWRSPVSMPRKFSRLTVEILDVEARQVWEISEEEALKAGIIIEWRCVDGKFLYGPARGRCGFGLEGQATTAQGAFVASWDRYYAKRGLGWEKNPWAWAVKLARREASTHA